MKQLVRRLIPSSLAGQIILLVALGLFIAQAVNFALLVRERDRQLLNAVTAPAVMRIIDALETRDAEVAPATREGRGRSRRAILSEAPPAPVGTRRKDVEERAAALFADSGYRPLKIQAFEQPAAQPPRQRRRFQSLDEPSLFRTPRPRFNRNLTVAVEYEQGQWASMQLRSAERQSPFGGWLIIQTLILYTFVLAPLLWIGRRLARPLQELTSSAQAFARTGAGDPVIESGPGDVRELTMAFNAMRARLKAMLDEKDGMLGAIGHDLRTPLASLRLRAESVPDEDERSRMVETIEEMSRTLDDILALARGARNAETAQKTDLSALADAVVQDFQELGMAVSMEDAPRTVVTVRPQQIRRALRNLIENAVKYGDGAAVSLSWDEGRVILAVNDQGPGIDEGRIDEMMQPFTRMEGSRNRDTGGAGLGLALVQAIIVDHGGELRLRNRQTGGLSAQLCLPA